MARILVLLSTYNGQKWLPEQLNSLYKQSSIDIDILVRDDGSTDNTIDILRHYEKTHQNITIIKGSNIRPIRSYYALIDYVLENDLDYDYYAFCDQDDVWKDEKLLCAVSALDKLDNTRALYFCAAEYIDSKGNHLGYKTIPHKGNFKTCLIRNYALGCTIVVNKQLFFECAKASLDIQKKKPFGYIPYHDVWFYSYAICSEAEIIYDSKPLLQYRQHGTNVTTAKKNCIKRYVYAYKSLRKVQNTHEQLASFLLESCPISNCSIKKYLNRIADYRSGILKTFRLAITLNTGHCSFSDNIMWRILVLLRLF